MPSVDEPVSYHLLTLKDIDGLSFEDAYGQLMEQIADLYKEHVYLLDCDTVDPDDMQIFLLI